MFFLFFLHINSVFPRKSNNHFFSFLKSHQNMVQLCYHLTCNLQNLPPQSLMGYIARKANEVKRCPKVKQNMRINMALTILDNIVRFKRNLKKLFGSKAEIWLSPQNLHCKISIFSNEKKSRA